MGFDSPRIYVDLDDVLCETARAFLGILRRDYRKTVDFEDIAWFDLGRSFELAPPELEEFMRKVHEPEILGSMEPVEGAVEVLEDWVAAGYEVAVVTGRPSATYDVSQRWLAEAGVPHQSLTFVDKYSRLGWPNDGPSVVPLSELGRTEYCLAVEDSADMAQFLAGELGLQVLLFDRPWNRQLPPSIGSEATGEIHRCNNWREIADRFPRP
ncbi:MAG: hypothetical protein WBG64_18070 [Thermoanaerobaculia bacterium]